MASTARANLVDPTVVGVYHCWNSCTRQEFNLGFSFQSGEDCGRREYVHSVQERLAGLYGIDVAFYATLDNHLHLILRNRPDVVEQWSDEEVARRWLTIAKIKRLGTLEVEPPTAERIQLELASPGRIATLRKRLAHISWFMGTLSENVSRHANRQDEKRGTFWQGPYQCRNLADEASILVCGIYLDLNVIRAGKAQTPQESCFTSIFDRLQAAASAESTAASGQPSVAPDQPVDDSSTTTTTTTTMPADGWLCELTLDERCAVSAPKNFSSATQRRASDKGLLPVTLEQYVQLLTWTGQQVRADKRGAIPVPSTVATLLERLHIQADVLVEAIEHFQEWFGRVMGTAARMAEAAARMGRRWLHGKARCAQVFG
jgi:hypothetical protein